MNVSNQLHKDNLNAVANYNKTAASQYLTKKDVENNNNNNKEVDQLKDLPVMNQSPNPFCRSFAHSLWKETPVFAGFSNTWRNVAFQDNQESGLNTNPSSPLGFGAASRSQQSPQDYTCNSKSSTFGSGKGTKGADDFETGTEGFGTGTGPMDEFEK